MSRQSNIEPRLIEVDNLVERGGGAVVEERRTRRECPQNRAQQRSNNTLLPTRPSRAAKVMPPGRRLPS